MSKSGDPASSPLQCSSTNLKQTWPANYQDRGATPVAHQDEDSGSKENGVLNQTSFNEYDTN